jgi:hypothetical protein
MQVTVKQGQTLFDIAIQTAGDPGAAFSAALLNDLSLTGDLVIGSVLIPPQAVNKRMLQHYSDAAIVPASAQNTGVRPEGIGYWIIEEDFVVS